MKKLYLIKNQELFQGEKHLKDSKNYFEGWYFKNTSNNLNIALIPGISISPKEKKAFIQVITNDTSYFINYDIKDFSYNHNPFYVKIKDNYFSEEKVILNINDQNLNITGQLNYQNNQNIQTNIFNPNIMGPFSYIPFMECNHAIISMKNDISGTLTINNQTFNLDNGIGYIEKDWGITFPKTYLWSQANNFKNNNVSFMFSTADIPFKIFNFKGLICVLKVDNQEYKFTTYNSAKIINYEVNNDYINITIKKGKYLLTIKSPKLTGHVLLAPVKGEMNKDVFESINTTTHLTLKRKKKTIFTGKSNNCGLEIVE